MKDKKQEKKETEESNVKNSETVNEIPRPMPKEMPDKLSEEKKESKDPLAEMTELLKRTQANFENYRKQQEKRIEEIRAFASKDILLQLLPLLDNLNLALKNSHCNPAEFVKGIELIYSQLFDILENNGVKPILTEKQTFDPCYHEALMKVESELPVNTIVEEWQKGFTLHNKVIRHAKVKISLGKKEKSVSEKNNPINNQKQS